MTTGAGGVRDEMPESAAPLIDLAAKWMADAKLIGTVAGATIEFLFDEQGRVRGWHAHERGGRNTLERAIS